MDMSQYLGVFIDEAREHMQNLNDKLLELEDHDEDPDLINSIFRSAHTLKGSAGQMGFQNMMELTHKMENVFDALRHGQLKVTSEVIDTLYETMDLLEAMIDTIEQGGTDDSDVSETVRKLQGIVDSENQGVLPAGEHQKTPEGASASENEVIRPAGSTDLDEYEIGIVRQAAAANMQVFEVQITLSPDCLLKAARALMVYRELETLGEIIKSVPPAEKLEQDDFDRQFTFVMVTESSEKEIRDAVTSVSEIEKAAIRLIQPDNEKGGKSDGSRSPKPEGRMEDGQKAKKVPGARKSAGHHAVARTIRVNLDRLDHLMNLFEELIIGRGRLEIIASSLNNRALNETVDTLKSVSDRLQETVLNLRMEPVEQVFNRFPRMVRSLSKELDKKVNLVIQGAETELDRTVIDEIGDPLMHMIRNSMDHGIEHPGDREKIGKSPSGTLELRAYHSGNHVFIEIEDDGAGINRDKVLSKAVEKKVVSADEAKSMSDKDVYNLLFASGFSTADKISDISGRGVGLDVVKSKIQALSGSVEVDSVPGKGTRFTVILPLTLSIINTLLVQISGETYAIPMSSIVETQLKRKVTIQSVNQKQVITYRQKVVPLIDLRAYLEVPVGQSDSQDSPHAEESSGSIVIARHGEQLIALTTDRLIGYQDIVIKPLGNYLKNVTGFSGATILGDGTVALILDCQSLINNQKFRLKAKA